MDSWTPSLSQLPRKIILGSGAQKLTLNGAHTEGTLDAHFRREGGRVNLLIKVSIQGFPHNVRRYILIAGNLAVRLHTNSQVARKTDRQTHTAQQQQKKEKALQYVVIMVELWIQMALVQILAP